MIPLGVLAATALRGPRLWTPAYLSIAPEIWLDWDSPLSMVSGFASSWGNQGSIGGSFDQSESSRRPGVVNDGETPLRFLRFDGSDDLMTSEAFRSVTNNTSAFTTFLVAKLDPAPSGLRRVLNFSIGGNPSSDTSVRAGLYLGPGTGQASAYQRRLDSNSAVAATVGYSAPAWTIFSGVHDWNSQRVEFWGGGDLLAASSTGQGSGSTSATNSNRVELGGTASVTGQNSKGDISAVFGFRRLLSVNERQRMEGWLAWKFDLVDTLASGHPYKLSPPTLD